MPKYFVKVIQVLETEHRLMIDAESEDAARSIVEEQANTEELMACRKSLKDRTISIEHRIVKSGHIPVN